MSNPQDEERWKKEAQQLKEDLKNRPKVIKKREVEIKVNTKGSNTNPSSKNKTTPTSSKKEDDFLRRQLGL